MTDDIIDRLRDYAANGHRPWIGIEGVFIDAAASIERLRRLLHKYGDRIPLATNARPDWQQEIDEAMEWVANNSEAPPVSYADLARAENELRSARSSMTSSTFYGRERTDKALADVKRIETALRSQSDPGHDRAITTQGASMADTLDDHIAAARKRIEHHQQAIEMLDRREITMGQNHQDVTAQWADTLRGYVAQDEKLIEYLESLA